MKNLFIVIVAILAIFCGACDVALAQMAETGTLHLEKVMRKTATRAVGTTNFFEDWVYMGNIADCWNPYGLGQVDADADSIILHAGASYYARAGSGDTADVSVIFYASVFKEDPELWAFNWSDSAGTVNKWLLVSDSLTTTVGTGKNGTAQYSYNTVGGTGAFKILPHLWAKVTLDSTTTSTDRVIEEFRGMLQFDCIK